MSAVCHTIETLISCEGSRGDEGMRGEGEGWGNVRGAGGIRECEGSGRDGGMRGE